MKSIIFLGAKISEILERLKFIEDKANKTGQVFYENQIVILTKDVHNLELELQKSISDTQNKILEKKIEELNKKVESLNRQMS